MNLEVIARVTVTHDLVAGFLNSAEASNLIAVLSDWYASYAQDTRTGNLVRDIDEILLQLTTQNKGGIARARDDAGVSLNIGSDNDNSIFPLSKRCA